LTPHDPQLKGAWYPGGFNPCAYEVRSWFQSLLSTKCNLCRYCKSKKTTDAAEEEVVAAKEALKLAVGGLYKLNAVVTHSLKGAWFQPLEPMK
jgi:hypothetical protein